MQRLGVLLMFLGFFSFCSFFSVVAIAPHSPMNTVVGTILCGSNEFKMDVSGEFGRTRKVSVGNFHCLGEDGTDTIVTDRYFLLLFAGSAVPFFVGIGLLSASASQKPASSGGQPQVVAFDFSSGQISTGDLSSKLKQLQDARDGGLISETEYEIKRAEILREFR